MSFYRKSRNCEFSSDCYAKRACGIQGNISALSKKMGVPALASTPQRTKVVLPICPAISMVVSASITAQTKSNDFEILAKPVDANLRKNVSACPIIYVMLNRKYGNPSPFIPITAFTLFNQNSRIHFWILLKTFRNYACIRWTIHQIVFCSVQFTLAVHSVATCFQK